MIKIYVANLGKYGEGELVGSWLELPATEEQMNNCFFKAGLGEYVDGEYIHGLEVDGVMYEEYAIHDFECDIEGLEINEYTCISDLNEIAEKLEDLNEDQLHVIDALLDNNYYSNVNEAIDSVDEYYIIESITNDEELGEYYLLEVSPEMVPDHLRAYIDYEKYGRDVYLDSADITYTKYGCLFRS